MSDILITGQVVNEAIANGYSVAAPEGYIETARPFRPVKCNQNDIDNKLDPVNGYVYFTLDTQKIFYGTGSEFLPMGGSSGIYYATKTFGEEAIDDTSFTVTDFADGKLPTNINDLIINVGKNETRNGFYKVIRIDEELQIVETAYLPVGGGGGTSGGTSGGDLLIEWIYPSNGEDSILVGKEYKIQFRVTATDKAGDIVPGTGVATWTRQGKKIATSTVTNGVNEFDLTPYLSPTINDGDNSFMVSVSMNTGGSVNDTSTKSWRIKVINLSLTWNYVYSPDNYINNDMFTLYWTPKGNIDATTYIWFDDNELDVKTIDIKANQMGSEKSYTFTSLSYGAHSVHMRMGAKIDTDYHYTDTITHELTFIKGGTKPILTVPFYQLSATQYDTVNIPFLIYDPEASEVEVQFSVGDVSISTQKYNRDLQYIPYTFGISGTLNLNLSSPGADPWTHEMTISPLALDVEEVPGYAFSLKASNFSGNDEIRKLEEDGLLTFSPNFDWINGGLKTEIDEQGHLRKYICVKNGTTMTINYNLFENNAIQNGKNFKFIFKAANCYDYNAKVLECYEKECGLIVNAQDATFVSTSTSDLITHYYENSYIELELDIWKKDYNYVKLPDNYIMYWVDGIPANVKPYSSTTTEIRQTVAKPITIGSTDCDVYVYLVKAYEKYLSEDEHLNNFIIDAPNTEEMLARYERNNILDTSGNISYSKLVEKNPDCNAFLYRIDRMTKSKKDPVSGCDYQRYHSNPEVPDETASNVDIKVQGTSSAAYGVAAYNIDAKFKNGFIDKNGKQSSGWSMSSTAIPVNYFCTKVNVASCENANNALNQEWYNKYQPYWDGHRRKARDDNKVARDCMEFIPGVMFIRDDNNKVEAENNNEKNIFWDNNSYMSLSPENRPYLQYAICNMGNSKKNIEVFHSPLSDYPNSCCVEVLDNQSDEHKMRVVVDESAFDGWIDENGEEQDPFYEFRFPDEDNFDYSAMKQNFIRLVNWMATNNPAAATNEPLEVEETYPPYRFKGFNPPGYTSSTGSGISLAGLEDNTYANTYKIDSYERRMAKMLSECEDYLVMDSIVYHYLFIERHTMVDNVAKNTFWSTEDGIHWDLTKNYDNDTADGNDNSGNLDYYYGLEIGDTTADGEQVFNAPGTVWLEFIKGLSKPREDLYGKLHSKGAWNVDSYLTLFKQFQSTIPERCWIYDYFRKYIRPRRLGLDEDIYLKRLEGGKKTHQRAQYETYQNIYQNSKYKTGISNTYIDLRLAAGELDNEDVVTMSSYIDCYVYAKIGGRDYHERNKRGNIAKIPVGAMIDSADDATCYIYYENMIQTLGNLAPLYPTYFNGGNATRLRSISIGSDAEGYKNDYLSTLGFSNNRMLETIHAQNVGKEDELSELDLSNLGSLSEIRINGGGFKGVSFADGGLLKTAYINDITTLTASNLDKIETINFEMDRNNASRYKLTSINVNNCPKIDTYTLVKKSNELSRYYLTKVNWVVDNINDITQSSGWLTGINVLDHLLRKDEKGNSLCLPIAGYTTQTALTGTLTINISGVNIDEFDIFKKYNKIFPNLNIVYGEAVGNNLHKASKIIFYESDEKDSDILFSVLTDGTMTIETLISGGESSPTSLKMGKPSKHETASQTFFWNANENGIDDIDWQLLETIEDWDNEYTHADLLTKTPPVSDVPYTMTFKPVFSEKTRLYRVVLRDYDGSDIDHDYLNGAEYLTTISLPTYLYRPHTQDIMRWTFKGWISPTDYLSNNPNPTLIADLTNNTKQITEDFYAYAFYEEEVCAEVASPLAYFNISPNQRDFGTYGTGLSISLKGEYKDILEGKLTLPAMKDNIPIICVNDFADMKKITHVYFEPGSRYTLIGEPGVSTGAFSRNTDIIPVLKAVYLPPSIRYIGQSSFINQYNLEDANLDALEILEVIETDAFRKAGSRYSEPDMKMKCTKLADTITKIGSGAFYAGGPNITITSLPANLITLQNWAFYGCSGLKITEFGSDSGQGIKYIGQGTFTMPSGVTTEVTGEIQIKKSILGIYQDNTSNFAPFYNYGSNVTAVLSYPASQYYADESETTQGITTTGTGVKAFKEPSAEEVV